MRFIKKIMQMRRMYFFGVSLLSWGAGFSLLAEEGVSSAAPPAIIGDALLAEEGYALLAEMSQRFGHRLTGTPGNAQSMAFLEAALQDLGLETR